MHHSLSIGPTSALWSLMCHRSNRPLCTATLVLSALVPSGVAAQSTPSRAAPPDTVLVGRLVNTVQLLAHANDPVLRALRADVDAQRAAVGATGFGPPLSGSVTLSETPRGHVDQGNVGVGLSRAFRQAPRLRAERRLATDELARREAQLLISERAARWTVVELLARAVTARATDGRLLAESRFLDAGEEGVRARFGVGEAPYSSVLRVRTERLRVQSDRADAAISYRSALIALGSLVDDGRDPNGFDDTQAMVGLVVDSLVAASASDAWSTMLPPRLSGTLLDSLVEQATAVQDALSRVVRARSDSALAAAMRATQIESSVGVQRIGQANGGAAFGPTIGLSMSLPFTASAANRASVIASVAAIRAAGQALETARNGTRAHLRTLAARYDAARARLALYDVALLRGAREEREAALAAFRTGGLSLLELIDFERALARADVSRLAAVADAVTAYAELYSGTATMTSTESTPSSPSTGR